MGAVTFLASSVTRKAKAGFQPSSLPLREGDMTLRLLTDHELVINYVKFADIHHAACTVAKEESEQMNSFGIRLGLANRQKLIALKSKRLIL